MDVPYEENPEAEIIVDNSTGSALENAGTVKNALVKYLDL